MTGSSLSIESLLRLKPDCVLVNAANTREISLLETARIPAVTFSATGFGYDVMSVEDVRKHAKRFSKAYSNGPWQTNFEEMAKKTVLKRVLKYAPLKSDFVRAVAQDETIKTKISEDMYSVSDDTVIETENYTVDETTGEVIESDGDAQ